MYSDYQDQKRREAGKRYEAFIAQRLRSEGWDVIENGLNGMNDHGIDLIATKDGVKRYVQCKGYKTWRTIHEDVVSQLLGSVAAVEGLDNLRGVQMYIYSPAQLDSYAQSEADRLGIRFARVRFPLRHRHHYRQKAKVTA